jgi:hypothetical protein
VGRRQTDRGEKVLAGARGSSLLVMAFAGRQFLENLGTGRSNMPLFFATGRDADQKPIPKVRSGWSGGARGSQLRKYQSKCLVR